MAKKKLSKFAAISMAAAMMLTAVMPTVPVFAAEDLLLAIIRKLGWKLQKMQRVQQMVHIMKFALYVVLH